MNNEDPSPAELLYLGMQLTRPLLRNITNRVEADLEGSGVSVGQRAVLEVLLNVGQATAPEITKLLQVKRQLVGRVLKELVEQGALTTIANPKHQTSHFYCLSPNSKKLIETIRSKEMADIDRFAERFTAEEIRAYYDIQTAINAEFSSDDDGE